MTQVIASAPGKVVLCGEYAVLDGAPAVCMAVNRRATAAATAISGDHHRVSAAGYTAVEGRFLSDGDAFEWLQGGDEFGLVESVFRAHGAPAKNAYSIELDSSEFLDDRSGEKLGLGSSAALAVALAAALRASVDVFDESLRAHRGFQQGMGSGIDVATAVHGGLIEYRMADSRATPLQWPAGLAFRLVWMGVAASTGAQLKKLNEAIPKDSRQQLREAARRMSGAWRSAADVLREYPAYIECLHRFSVDHELGIFDAGHYELVNEAAAAGLVYKPCGAGGGDVGILLGPSVRALDGFLAGRGNAVHCQLDTRGVKLEER